ncbi:MAG TPA: Lrp/AsnC family transcriptional regulator [Burkholderiaceae bacterium]|nr:Lrp/AsnC family transcriptional regulator [Burkholderiaceae bacterium]
MPRAAVLPAGVDETGFRLLNDWQRGFPLESRPFAALGARVGRSEDEVLIAFRDWQRRGIVSRIGAVFAPRRVGASALVAMAVPGERLVEVATRVSAEPGVNHNYEREHRFNLWFVAGAVDQQALASTLDSLQDEIACPTLVLPLLEEYHIDLGFDLGARPGARRGEPGKAGSPSAPGSCTQAGAVPVGAVPDSRADLSDSELNVLGVAQEGLPIVAMPYAELGRRIGASEARVIDTIADAQASGLIRRWGVVVRHHEQGIGANAMCVWDVPDDRVGELGRRLAREPAVTLCYRRPRVLPDWPYNLFCMIHGSAREAVLAARADIAARLGLDARAHAVLFSGRRFKQRGARLLPVPAARGGPVASGAGTKGRSINA